MSRRTASWEPNLGEKGIPEEFREVGENGKLPGLVVKMAPQPNTVVHLPATGV
ncbi:MAG: hypothetical protein WCA77_01340 [Thermoplasmata archaeon]